MFSECHLGLWNCIQAHHQNVQLSGCSRLDYRVKSKDLGRWHVNPAFRNNKAVGWCMACISRTACQAEIKLLAVNHLQETFKSWISITMHTYVFQLVTKLMPSKAESPQQRTKKERGSLQLSQLMSRHELPIISFCCQHSKFPHLLFANTRTHRSRYLSRLLGVKFGLRSKSKSKMKLRLKLKVTNKVLSAWGIFGTHH